VVPEVHPAIAAVAMQMRRRRRTFGCIT